MAGLCEERRWSCEAQRWSCEERRWFCEQRRWFCEERLWSCKERRWSWEERRRSCEQRRCARQELRLHREDSKPAWEDWRPACEEWPDAWRGTRAVMWRRRAAGDGWAAGRELASKVLRGALAANTAVCWLSVFSAVRCVLQSQPASPVSNHTAACPVKLHDGMHLTFEIGWLQ